MQKQKTQHKCFEWTMNSWHHENRAVEKWSNCVKRLYLSSKIEIETKIAADLGSPATEKQLPECNPRDVCIRRKRKVRKKSQKKKYYTSQLEKELHFCVCVSTH